ncbi:hypothetical protein NP233_g11783 [Leucocoprinus birnbaumii]|uniref:Uncharacterized protein n=1 Tax=Leucocoprinus birnbaumii TaxID=56174 RepID=A0AAD5VG48_9AGAR|nr:hypothetical protein NP233_g11783 [Leucocoprinus birnbaumii]
MPQRQFPAVVNRYFRLRAFPSALLMTPQTVTPPPRVKTDTWANRVARATESRLVMETPKQTSPSALHSQLLDFVAPPILPSHPEGSIPMLLFFQTSKAKTHKHCVKRRRLRTKLKGVIELIVTHGAKTDDTKQLIFNEEEVRQRGDKWILPDWAYLCSPDAACYMATYAELVAAMRGSLQRLWDAGMRLEATWAEAEMRKHQTPSPLLSPRSFYKGSTSTYSPKRTKGNANTKVRLLARL